jgi:molybdopterin converting factor subunit 1
MATAMTVRVKLFAAAKDRAGRDELKIELPPGATIANLRDAIAKAHPALAPIITHAMWAIDTTYANEATTITEQHEIALIPPVSGG